jgi:5,10-methylenetetrahydrofolate reductase
VARLSKTETETLPDFHVQTVSGGRCRSLEEARFKIRTAAAAGASALLLVSGDSAAPPSSSSSFCLDAIALLREARALRAAGEIDDDVLLACVANPTAEGGGDGPARLEAKIEAGAELVVTQPNLVFARHRAWWEEVRRRGLDRETEIVFGVAIATSSAGMRFWMGLAGAHDLPGAEEATREWAAREAEMTPETFRAWCEERADLAVSEALADPAVDGVHLMPVTAAGYGVAARLGDGVRALSELRER